MKLSKAWGLTLIAGTVVWIVGFAIYSMLRTAEMGEWEKRVAIRNDFMILCVGATMIFQLGMCLYAVAKGYNPLVGFGLGFLGLIGTLIFVILPDRQPRKRKSVLPDSPFGRPAAQETPIIDIGGNGTE